MARAGMRRLVRNARLTTADMRDIAASWSAGGLRAKAGMEVALRRLLLGGVFPLWLGAGLADWYLHRRTHIERTAGPRESLIHQLMFAETGVPVLIGLFCEVNAGVIATAYGCAGLHGLTAIWDQVYAEPRRAVSPLEQHIHSYLEVSPVMAAVLLTGLHWDQARALLGRDQSPPRYAIRLKRRDPLSARTRILLLAAVGLFGVLPYAEELYRCWRTRPTVSATPEPDHAATGARFRTPEGRSPVTAPPQDVTAVIAPQHEHVKVLLENVRRQTGQARADAFHTLRLTLALHETAEQQAIHPQAQRLLTNRNDRPATDRIAEEQTAGQAIAALELLDVDSDQFNSTFGHLASDVVDHATAEEDDEWPVLRQISDPTIINGMIEQVQAVTCLASDPAAPGIQATFAEMQQWAKTYLPHPPAS